MEHFLKGETESTPFQIYSLNKASAKCKTSIYVFDKDLPSIKEMREKDPWREILS